MVALEHFAAACRRRAAISGSRERHRREVSWQSWVDAQLEGSAKVLHHLMKEVEEWLPTASLLHDGRIVSDVSGRLQAERYTWQDLWCSHAARASKPVVLRPLSIEWAPQLLRDVANTFRKRR